MSYNRSPFGKMKKRILTIAAVLCCALTMVLFTSCKKEEAKPMYTYSASGDLKLSSSDPLMPGQLIVDYQSVLDQIAPGSGLDTPADAKVIAACDTLYASQKATYPRLTGYVKITRVTTITGTEPTYDLVKQYDFKDIVE